MMMRSFIALTLLLCRMAVAGDLTLELLPSGRAFRLTTVDPREIKMALSFEGGSQIHAAIGNYFSLLGLSTDDPEPFVAHFGLEGAGFFGMRQSESRFPLETTDGLIGVYLEGKRGPWQAQLRYTHVSSHMADGSNIEPIAYSREFASLRFGYSPSYILHLYAGTSHILNSVPKVAPWGLQWGGTVFIPAFSGRVTPFVGLDVQWKQESAYNPSFNAEIGLALNNPLEAYHSFRFFYSYFTGADPRGQFFTRELTAHSLGIEMQI